MTLFNPCIKAIGPLDAKIMAIGEAPGANEEALGRPFVGGSGYEFARMLLQAGLATSIDPKDQQLIEYHRARDHVLFFETGHVIAAPIYMTNVLWTRPPNNKMEEFCGPRSVLPFSMIRPFDIPLGNGKYLHPDLHCEWYRLIEEIELVKPNLILCLGGTATWALLNTSKISTVRGSISHSNFGKVLPTFHPAYILRDWGSRPIVIADLMKARLEAEFPEIRRPERHVVVNPSLQDVQGWKPRLLGADMLAIDTETKGGTITELGFAISRSSALVIPFFDARVPGGSYWSRAEEIQVRKICYSVLSSPVPKVFQNGMYDIQYFVKEGYKICNALHDTMILQHALYPGMPKSLGFLGSIHCNEMAWKLLRTKETLKRED